MSKFYPKRSFRKPKILNFQDKKSQFFGLKKHGVEALNVP